jgi:predicted metal-dependent hydrolase
MIYGREIAMSNIGKCPINESQELDLYLESVLNESSYNDLKRKINDLAKALKEGKANKEDIKELYQEIKATDDSRLVVSLAFTLLSCISASFGTTFAKCDLFGPAMISYIISIISSILSLKFLNSNDMDKIYIELMKTESEAMKALRIAKEDNDKDSEELAQKTIDLCEDLKKKRREFLNAKTRGIELDESVILEYKGDEIKTNTFVQALKDIDTLIKYNFANLDTVDDSIDEMLKLIKSSNKSNISKNYVEMVKIGRGINDDLAKVKDVYAPLTYALLQKECKRFNNKYSQLSMTQRENLDNKMMQYCKELKKYYDKYNEAFQTEILTPALDKCRAIDGGTAAQMSDVIYSWINYLISEVNYTKGDIVSIGKTLNVTKIKSSFLYNTLNKMKE